MSLRKHLSNLKAYIDESNQTNSTNDKIAVLQKYTTDVPGKGEEVLFIRKVLHHTYNNQLQFNVSMENLKKNKDICAPENIYNGEGEIGNNLFAMLTDLYERRITGHAAISAVNAFFKEYVEFERELSYIIDRNLQTRVTATIINKVIPNLIPEFEVALGYDYDSLDETKDRAEKLIKANKHGGLSLEQVMQSFGSKYDKKPNITDGSWYASRKMDGLRALAFINDEGDTTFFSREGNVLTTFAVVATKLKEMGFKNIILDGEMCLIKPDGSDDFNGMQKEFRKKNHTIENARYRIFDVLTHEEFRDRKSTVTLSERQLRLINIGLEAWQENTIVRPIKQHQITGQEQFESLREQAANDGWEGLIVRKDMAYEGRRTKNLLKVKNFKEGEFLVIAVENAVMRIAENGKETPEETFAAATIDYHGEPVQVGSGFSREERRAYYKDKTLILGKMITVKYFETTINKQGTSKLRFPTFKCIKEKY